MRVTRSKDARLLDGTDTVSPQSHDAGDLAMARTENPTRESAMPDGTPHRIDFATFVRLGELGIYPLRSELVDGIVYDMSPKGDAHYFAQVELVEQLSDARAGRYRAGTEPTLKVDDRNGPMPDVLVTARDAPISPASADLIVEVADSSLLYDRTANVIVTPKPACASIGLSTYSTKSWSGICPRVPTQPQSCAPATHSRRTHIPMWRSISPQSSPLPAAAASSDRCYFERRACANPLACNSLDMRSQRSQDVGPAGGSGAVAFARQTGVLQANGRDAGIFRKVEAHERLCRVLVPISKPGEDQQARTLDAAVHSARARLPLG